MEMTLHPQPEGVLEIVHRELHSEQVLHPVRLLATPTEAGLSFLKRCSMCNQIKTQGFWSEIDDAINAGLHPDPVGLRVIYGVCPRCLTRPGVPL